MTAHLNGLSPNRERAVELYLKGVPVSQIERKAKVLRKELYQDLKRKGIKAGRRNPFRTNGTHEAAVTAHNTANVEVARAASTAVQQKNAKEIVLAQINTQIKLAEETGQQIITRLEELRSIKDALSKL